MSRAGEITLPFGDRDRIFRLAIGEWRKIQEACKAGPFEIYARLGAAAAASAKGLGTFEGIMLAAQARLQVDDVRMVIYHGLIGGGETPNEAGRVTKELVDERPIGEPVPTAYLVVMASVAGASDERLGELGGAAKRPSRRRSQMAS